MLHKIDREQIEELIEMIKTLHIVSRETVSDEDLIAALAFFRPAGFLRRRVPDHNDVMTYHLLKAFQAFRLALPIEPGESPFEYQEKRK